MSFASRRGGGHHREDTPIPTDLFVVPPAALRRAPGHRLRASRSKMAGLVAPLDATGVPLGGIGTGSITRASDGRFSRWTFAPGGPRSFHLPANGFVLWARPEGGQATCRALQPKPGNGGFGPIAFEDDAPGWAGLFPLAWHDHGAVGGVAAECVSFSPVIVGDPAVSALPVAVFRWQLRNRGPRAAEASLVFHFANMNGAFDAADDGPPRRVAAGLHNRPMSVERGVGIVLDRRRTGEEPSENDGEWAILARADAGGGTGDGAAAYGATACFDATDPSDTFWAAVASTGDAPDLGPGWLTESGFREVSPTRPAAAVSARVTVPANGTREVSFALAWDLPAIRFGAGRRWHRAHTDRWGVAGRSAAAIAAHGLDHAEAWQRRIADWHAVETERLGAAPHRAGAAINELSFLVEGMSVLCSARGSPDGRRHFGLIECPDYALYNTLDLWVYAAEAVGRFDPDLATGVVEDFADHLLVDERTPRRHRWNGTAFPLNPVGACPHDLGGPGEDPFVVPNAYTHRDPTVWKDLNSDFVLCAWREAERMGRDWAARLFPAVRAAIDRLQAFDRDGDGLIENDGTPDQTFDNIPMRGPSSYCGGLWIAALLAAARIADMADEPGRAAAWRAQGDRAREAFRDRLFDGARFRVDTAGPLRDACFVEQLLGPFLARRLGLGDIVASDQARSALRSVFEANFLDEGRGQGAVTLARVPPDAFAHLPHQDDVSFQTREVQPGFNMSLAAQLEAWGLRDEAERLRRALHRELCEERNLAFQTPAAFDVGAGTCRAILNMRPLAVWWMRPETAPGRASP